MRRFVLLVSLSLFALPAAALAGFTPDGNMPRSKLPKDSTWKLDALFASDAAFDKGLAAAAADVKKLSQFKGKLGQTKKLHDCLTLYFRARLAINKLTLYANMRFDSAQKDTKLQANNDRALDLLNQLMTASTFIREEVLSLDDRAMSALVKNDKRLDEYRPYLDELRRRRSRVLEPASERVLALAGDNLWAEIDLNEIPSDHEKTFRALLSNLALPTIKDEKGKPVQLTLSNYGKFRGSKDRRVRRDAVEAFFKTLKENQHGFAATFAGQVRFNIFLARARGYDSAVEAYLDKDNIDPKVYRSLIAAVKKNLKPLHDYVTFRKQALGLKDIHIYDLYTPIAKSVEMKIPYAEAREILPKALAPLGKEYVDTLALGLDPKKGWIDVYPHKDKASGAFCSSVYQVHPFVKMNYYDELDDLSTLAHEYGHALHAHLSMNNQPYITFNYPAFIAEIASTINEKFLSDYMVAEAKDDALKLYILGQLVESIRTTIYRQTLFAEFELEAHTAAEKGTVLTADFLNNLYGRLIREYYGPGFAVGENDDIEWAYVPHFYYKFYMYSYATGLSAGIALADRVQKKGAPARDAYLGMLKGGSSKPPLTLLKEAGVDLTKPTAVEAAAKLLQDTLAQMRAISGKR